MLQKEPQQDDTSKWIMKQNYIYKIAALNPLLPLLQYYRTIYLSLIHDTRSSHLNKLKIIKKKRKEKKI